MNHMHEANKIRKDKQYCKLRVSLLHLLLVGASRWYEVGPITMNNTVCRCSKEKLIFSDRISRFLRWSKCIGVENGLNNSRSTGLLTPEAVCRSSS